MGVSPGGTVYLGMQSRASNYGGFAQLLDDPVGPVGHACDDRRAEQRADRHRSRGGRPTSSTSKPLSGGDVYVLPRTARERRQRAAGTPGPFRRPGRDGASRWTSVSADRPPPWRWRIGRRGKGLRRRRDDIARDHAGRVPARRGPPRSAARTASSPASISRRWRSTTRPTSAAPTAMPRATWSSARTAASTSTGRRRRLTSRCPARASTRIRPTGD